MSPEKWLNWSRCLLDLGGSKQPCIGGKGYNVAIFSHVAVLHSLWLLTSGFQLSSISICLPLMQNLGVIKFAFMKKPSPAMRPLISILWHWFSIDIHRTCTAIGFRVKTVEKIYTEFHRMCVLSRYCRILYAAELMRIDGLLKSFSFICIRFKTPIQACAQWLSCLCASFWILKSYYEM